MKRLVLVAVATLAAACCNQTPTSESITYPELNKNSINFIIASDLGRNGYYDQKPIAALMGTYAENIDIEFIAAAGDVHHFEGVASVNDPLWMTNYELIYDHPELMIDWYAISGNHEYRGNTQAVLDYTNVSRRWSAPSKYFTKVIEVGDSSECRLVFIDTTPMMDKYRNDTIQYPDAYKQDMEKQLQWIDSVLLATDEKWTIVIGHHPVYADTKKDQSERSDMQRRLVPVLEKNGVDAYFCGHIHNFQHIKPQGSTVEYVVNSSASLSRKVSSTDDTKFCGSDPGFTLCSLNDNSFRFIFINQNGEAIYRFDIDK